MMVACTDLLRKETSALSLDYHQRHGVLLIGLGV